MWKCKWSSYPSLVTQDVDQGFFEFVEEEFEEATGVCAGISRRGEVFSIVLKLMLEITSGIC